MKRHAPVCGIGACAMPALLAAALWMPLSAETVTAPPGTYRYSWIGNDYFENYGTDRQKMIVSASHNLFVTPEGTVFVAGYSEVHRGGYALDSSGVFIRAYKTNSGFGGPQGCVVADANYVYYGTPVGLARCSRNSSAGVSIGWYSRRQIAGLALRNGVLYVASRDSAYGDPRINTMRTSDMTQTAQWTNAAAGAMAVDQDGRLWVAGWEGKTYADGSYDYRNPIVSYNPDGSAGPTIPAFTDWLRRPANDYVSDQGVSWQGVMALAVDNQNRLWVGGLYPDSRIHIYGSLGSTPVEVATFGEAGGILSATARGRHGPGRFYGVNGIGFDSRNNVYVQCLMAGWSGSIVESYTSSGSLRWRVQGLGKEVEAACLDPGDLNSAYTSEHRFTMDWTQTGRGRECSPHSFTMDIFKYPTDHRDRFGKYQSHRVCYGMVRIHGRRFLVCTMQVPLDWEFYRFTDGDIAVPSVVIGNASIRRVGYDKAWPGAAERFVWTDANGDGTIQDNEYAFPGGPIWRLAFIDSEGSFWNNVGPNITRTRPAASLDAHGNPVYDFANGTTSFPAPAEAPGDWREIFYDPGSDELYCLVRDDNAYTANLHAYRNFTKGPVSLTWSKALPFNDAQYTPGTGYGGGRPRAPRVTGQYVFVPYGMEYVRILRRDNGNLVGTMVPDAVGYGGTAGAVDAAYPLNAYLLPGGEYAVTIESCGASHVGLFRWRPPGATAVAGPTHPSSGRPAVCLRGGRAVATATGEPSVRIRLHDVRGRTVGALMAAAGRGVGGRGMPGGSRVAANHLVGELLSGGNVVRWRLCAVR